LLPLVGCDGEPAAPDGAAPDAGRAPLVGAAEDASSADAAVDGSLEAPSDAGVAKDAAPGDAAVDSGVGVLDASSADGGAAPDCPRRYYLAADGDDARDGRSAASALQTLARVQELLVVDPPGCEVEVHVAPGLYRRQRVSWTFTMPEHPITFRAANREDRPIFDGCVSAGDCPGGTFFTLRHSAGEATNLHFWYLHVRNYQTAISLNGARDVEATSNGHNRIFGCYFERIGNVFDSAVEPSTACVRLVNSDDNEIANNHFVDVVNTRSGALIHAIYVAHRSDRNIIRANRFL